MPEGDVSSGRPPPPSEPPSRLRVKDLAKRFECEVPQTVIARRTPSQKKIGKFRVAENGQMYRINKTAIRVGIVRKKSSLKKKTLSYPDIASFNSVTHPRKFTSSTLSLPTESQWQQHPKLDSRPDLPTRPVPVQRSEAFLARCSLPRPAIRQTEATRPELPARPTPPPVPTEPPRRIEPERPPQTPPIPRPREKPRPPAKPARLISPCPPREPSPSLQSQHIEVTPSCSFTNTSMVTNPRLPRKFTSKAVEEEGKDNVPTYREQAAVSLTVTAPNVAGGTLSRPRQAPPAPPTIPLEPPSRERIQRNVSKIPEPPSPIRGRSMSSSSDDVYQQLPSPDDVPPGNGFTKFFYSPPTTSMPPIPRVPTIPPPQLPRRQSDEYSDENYDEIDTMPTEPPMAPNSAASSSVSSSSTDYVTQIYCAAADLRPYQCSGNSTCECVQCRNRFSQLPTSFSTSQDALSSEIMSTSTNTPPLRYQSATLNRKKPSSQRPTSSLDIDKLLRFKSEIQLNFTRKMGQLRDRVGDRKTRSPKVRVGATELDTDSQGRTREHGTPRDPDDDRYIYGDDWSSEDEDDNDVYDDRRSSMYKELEQQLNKAFPRMSSESEYESADLMSNTVGSAHVAEATSSSALPEDMTILSKKNRPENLDLKMQRLSLDKGSSPDEVTPEDYDYTRQYTSRLAGDQPLYQLYMLAEQEKLIDDAGLRETEGVQEEDKTSEKDRKIKCRRESSASSDSGRGADCSSASALTSNTSMRRERLIAVSHFGSQRSLWCELPEVKSAGLLETLDDETKLRQEAYFEVITSEASYLRSLNILITHFMASQEMLGSKSSLSVISNADRKHLFSNIFAVRDCSERLLCDLESRLEENLVLDDVCDILAEHFEKHFDVYVKYCSNQVYQDRTLRRLKSENGGFLSAVSKLESDRQCQGLDMRSFLMLPMQRVTRYPLLMYAVIDRLSTESEKYQTASRALLASNKVVRECNEGARRMERTEQLLEVDRRLIYKDPDLKRIPLVSNSRYLVKRGGLIQLVERRTKGLLQNRQKARSLHVFLFSDIIMITKKKLNGTYVCKDYAARRYVDIEPVEVDNPKIPPGAVASLATRPHLFLCVLMRNARGKQTELLLNAESETDRERWLSAIRPPTSVNPEEKVYAEWDCPQAIAVHNYNKNQDDELDLHVGDTVNILRKMPDGWLFGERGRDGASGWFPSSYVQQILNDHVRANNYRQRLRLIQAASGTAARASISGRGSAPLMDRLRRMSNPRTFFQSGTVGL